MTHRMSDAGMAARLSRYYLCLLVIVAPLPLGANREWAGYLLLAMTLAVSALVLLISAIQRHPPWPAAGAVAVMAPLLLFGALVGTQILVGEHFIVAGAGFAPGAAGLQHLPPWLPLSIDPAASRYQLWLALLYLLVFALTIHAVSRPSHARLLLYAIAVSALLQTGIGLYEQLNRIDLFGLRERLGAMNGTFVNRNHFAGFVGAGGAIAIAILARRLTQHHSYVPGRTRNLLIRWIDVFLGTSTGYLMLAAVTLSAMAASGSRGATFSLAGATILCLLWLAASRKEAGRFAWGIYLAVIIVLVSAVLYDTLVLARAGEMLEEMSAEARWPLWQLAIEVVAERPWTGHGPGSFTDAFAPHRDGTLGRYTVDYAHSHYLELAVETGLIGLLLLGAFCAMVVRAAASATGSASRERSEIVFAALLVFVAIALHASVEFNLKIPAIAILLHLVAGIIIALRSPGSEPEGAPRRRRRR